MILKKLLIASILVLASTLCRGQVQFANEREKIIKEEYTLVLSGAQIIYGYCDRSTGKYGFVRGMGLRVVIKPIYDNVYTTSGVGIVGVEYNGKWGAVETNLFYSLLVEQPIVKCEYDSVVPLDDAHVRVRKDGKQWVIDIRGISTLKGKD